MTSTFPAKNRVSAFFQEMIRSGSYEAFSSSVAFILKADFSDKSRLCQGLSTLKPLSLLGFNDLLQCLNARIRKSPQVHYARDDILHSGTYWTRGQYVYCEH